MLEDIKIELILYIMEHQKNDKMSLTVISSDGNEFEIGEELKFCEVLKNLIDFQKDIFDDDRIESEYNSEIIQIFISILKFYLNVCNKSPNECNWMFAEKILNMKIPEEIIKLMNVKDDNLLYLNVSYKLLCLADRWRCNIVKIVSMISISNIINRDIDNITNEQLKQIFDLES